MPSPMPDFEFLALGTPTLRHAGASRPLPAERLTQLLAVLVLRQGWVTRESLLALLWPEFPAAAARRNLRKLLFKLRQVPGLPPVEADGDALRWRVATDHQQFERALQAAQWAEAVERARSAARWAGVRCGRQLLRVVDIRACTRECQSCTGGQSLPGGTGRTA